MADLEGGPELVFTIAASLVLRVKHGAVPRRRGRERPNWATVMLIVLPLAWSACLEPADERVHSDAVLATCVRHWSALAPLHRWLTDNLQGP